MSLRIYCCKLCAEDCLPPPILPECYPFVQLDPLGRYWEKLLSFHPTFPCLLLYLGISWQIYCFLFFWMWTEPKLLLQAYCRSTLKGEEVFLLHFDFLRVISWDLARTWFCLKPNVSANIFTFSFLLSLILNRQLRVQVLLHIVLIP